MTDTERILAHAGLLLSERGIHLTIGFRSAPLGLEPVYRVLDDGAIVCESNMIAVALAYYRSTLL